MTEAIARPVNPASPWKIVLVHALTASRLLLTPFVVWGIVDHRPLLAGSLCAIAGFTDAFDGALARKFHATSIAGQYLDPISDKVLLSAVYLSLAWIGSVPWALVVLIFSRDLALVAASAIAMRLTTYDNYRPTIWGKISTFTQLVTAVIVLASNAFPSILLRDSGKWLMALTAAATLWSAIHYAWRGISYFRKPLVRGQ